MITALIAAAVWTPLSVVACLALHRARQAQTPTPEPDDHVELITAPLPPVPPSQTWNEWLSGWEPAAWDDVDEISFRWYAEGRSAR
jgi:hypothetical protein